MIKEEVSMRFLNPGNPISKIPRDSGLVKSRIPAAGFGIPPSLSRNQFCSRNGMDKTFFHHSLPASNKSQSALGKDGRVVVDIQDGHADVDLAHLLGNPVVMRPDGQVDPFSRIFLCDADIGLSGILSVFQS